MLRRRKASRRSVDVGQALVVPIEVSAAVDPVLGAGVRVSALLEPPERRMTTLMSAGYYQFAIVFIFTLKK